MRCLVALLLTLLMAGCTTSDPKKPAYMPIPDATLYARIGELPGVMSVDLHWTNGLDRPNGYGGEVRVRPEVNPVTVLDRVLGLLRQGRPRASLAGVLVVPRDAPAVSPVDLGLWSEVDYDARYGPQPGAGTSPPAP